MGFNRQGGVRATGPQRKRKRGSRYGDEGENREPTRVPEKEGRTAQEDEASVAQCYGHARAAQADPATDGVRSHTAIETRHAWRCQTGHRNDVKSGNSNSLTYVRLTFLLVFSFFFSFLQKIVLPLLLG
jgi:hypothetical protein